LKILITNNTLANRAGTELYVRDLAIGLLKRGHEPIAYSTRLGEVAKDIRAARVLVTDDLDTIVDSPDIIHGHHHLDTMTALLCLPSTPAIYFCHGSTPWEEAAPRFPRILRYVAVDHACRDRLVTEHAIPPNRIRTILNFVDLEKFKPRAQLPPHPRRALIFSNQASEYTHTGAVRLACERAGIALNVVGKKMGNVCAEPESLLGNYDIVFAKGRAALEALAVGAAVVLCDAVGVGPMVTSQNMAELRPLNFGIRVLREPLSHEVLSRAIARYDPIDAASVSGFIRANAGRDAVIDELLSLYQEVIDEHHHSSNCDIVSEQHAMASYLRELASRLHRYDQAQQELAVTEAALETTRTQLGLIENSRSWRLIRRYIAIKHNHVLPAYYRMSRLRKAAAISASDPKAG